MVSDFAARLEAAVKAETVTADTARGILNWIGPDGRIQPPTERAAAVAREVLAAAGLEYRPAKDPDPAATTAGCTSALPRCGCETVLVQPARARRFAQAFGVLTGILLIDEIWFYYDQCPDFWGGSTYSHTDSIG